MKFRTVGAGVCLVVALQLSSVRFPSVWHHAAFVVLFFLTLELWTKR